MKELERGADMEDAREGNSIAKLERRKAMDEDTKRQLDGIVLELWKQGWQKIAERKKGEWQVAYTLWTAFAAFIVLILKGDLLAQTRCSYLDVLSFLGVFVVGSLLCCIHGYWLIGYGKRLAIDRKMAIHYEDILRKRSYSQFEDSFKQILENKRKEQDILMKQEQSVLKTFTTVVLGDWSRGAQFSVTMLLFLLALLASARQLFLP
jgi:hypothetical protein